MQTFLTEQERETINAARDILVSKLTEGQYWTFGWRWFRNNSKPSNDLTMFTPLLDTQHTFLPGDTLADKFEHGLRLIADEAASVPSPEEAKKQRIQSLRDQLEKLEAEQSA